MLFRYLVIKNLDVANQIPSIYIVCEVNIALLDLLYFYENMKKHQVSWLACT